MQELKTDETISLRVKKMLTLGPGASLPKFKAGAFETNQGLGSMEEVTNRWFLPLALSRWVTNLTRVSACSD
jgi:hypothetical protein